jgi:hypothetical protein
MAAPPTETEFATRDLTVGAFLLASGVRMDRVWWDERRRGWFVFRAPPAAMRSLVDDYVSKKAEVPARGFADAIRVLKWLTHEE